MKKMHLRSLSHLYRSTKTVLSFASLFSLGFYSSSSFALNTQHYLKFQEQKAEESYNLKIMMGMSNIAQFSPLRTIEGTFDQKINHKNKKDRRKFKQRYFVNSDYAEGDNAPVFYFICGESECSGIKPYYSFVEYAKKYKAHIVALEHRFYGKSQPFKTLTAKTLRFLDTESALADLANFQDYMVEKNNWKGSWVAIGGSYAGSLAAYYRLIYPDKVVGALASSGPVEAKVSFEEYDENVTSAAGEECAKDIRDVVQIVENSLNNPEEFVHIKHLFKADKVQNPTNFLYAIADMASGAVQYGMKDEFCGALHSSEDKLDAYAKAGTKVLDRLGVKPEDTTGEGSKSIKVSDYNDGIGMRQWIWQTCTEYGYYQVAHSNPEFSTRSSLITVDHHNSECFELFGLKKPVNTDKINEKYYKPLLDAQRDPQASHIFFTNGSTDPWQQLSITTERGNNTNPLFSYLTIEGAAHCDDLFSSYDSHVRNAQNKFESLLEQWL